MTLFRHEPGHFSPHDVEAAQAEIGPDDAFDLIGPMLATSSVAFDT